MLVPHLYYINQNCYNIEIGRPVFDRIELNPIP